MITKVSIDFETYCELPIKEVGSWKYTEDPSLDVMCLAYKIGDGPVKIYRPYENDPPPLDLFDEIAKGSILQGWNILFEYAVWMNYCVPQLEWPTPAAIQWKDTAAKAAAHSLPLALDKCGVALKLPPELMKFKQGKGILDKLASPDKKTGQRTTRNKAPRTYEELYAYCIQDVITESHIDSMLIDLREHENDFWYVDQLINRRGIPIDVESVSKIAKRVATESAKANSRVPGLTGGRIDRITQVQRIVAFCKSSGIKIENCQAKTVDKILDYAKDNPDKIKDRHKNALELLSIRKWYGKSAVTKYNKMLMCVTNDGRVRGTMVFRGAHTGRWVGRLIQPHNYFKPTIHKNSDVDHFVNCVANRSIECVEELYQPYIHAAASATRMMLAAPKDKIFFIADYAQIEARGVCWLADDDKALAIWADDTKDAYVEMASKIYNVNPQDVDDKQRFVGKGIVLGAGFGLGWKGFINTMRDMWGVENFPEQLAKDGISAFRDTHPKIVKLWNRVEEASITAVQYPGQIFTAGHLKFYKPKDREFLYMMLPSKRLLAYPYPKIENKRLPWGAYKDQLTYKAQIDNHWHRISTYGGSTVENADQGFCAEIMADGMMRCELDGYPIIFTVHDEIIAEITKHNAEQQAKEIHARLETPPVWAPNFPLKVEAQLSTRYKKA